jgi:hypothetical protein
MENHVVGYSSMARQGEKSRHADTPSARIFRGTTQARKEASEGKEDMKYFKAELLAKCRSMDDDVADAAAKKWQQAIVAYRTHLREIRGRLPMNARRLMSKYVLHDAKVPQSGFAKDANLFVVLIQIEGSSSQPGNMMQLYYTLPNQHSVFTTGTIPIESKPGSWILYNEFALSKQANTFMHSILLSDDTEWLIRFHDLQFHVFDVPVQQRSTPAAKEAKSAIKVKPTTLYGGRREGKDKLAIG